MSPAKTDGRYGKVYSAFWAAARSWSDDEKLLALYILTSRHSNSEGLSNLPAFYAAGDMGWEIQRLTEAWDGLVRRGWMLVDDDWVLVPFVFEQGHKPPKTKDHLTGAVNRVRGVPLDSRVYARFVELVGAHFAELLPHLPSASPMPPECHSSGTHEAPESSSKSSSSSKSKSNSSSTAGAALPVAQPTDVDPGDGADLVRVSYAMSAAGMAVSAEFLTELRRRLPQVDIEKCAGTVVERYREQPLTKPESMLERIASHTDAPMLPANREGAPS